MSTALRQSMSLEDFLDWESRQDIKYEFDGFQPVAMVGVTGAHSTIQANLMRLIGNGLRGHTCRVHGSDLKIRANHSIRYPDAFIVCSPVAARTTVVDDPVVVFEILSDASSYRDRIVKNREYRATPSIQRYVILEQIRPAATVYARAGNKWLADVVLGDADLVLPEVGISLPMAEIYEGVPVQPDTDAERDDA